ncbi:Putative Striatin-domain-containing protein (Fragment) [Rhizopus microsporus]
MSEQAALEYTLPGVLHFLQAEWRRFERERNEWTIERAELKARIALLEGERKGIENSRLILMKRVKMLEYALRQERKRYSDKEEDTDTRATTAPMIRNTPASSLEESSKDDNDTNIKLREKNQGISMVLHGIASFSVFIFSFRPFVNYYGAIFLMYELSTIFLNFHWFMDKIGWSGSRIQLINGVVLLLTFFGARVVFGTVMSVKMWIDIYAVKDHVPLRYWIVYGSANFATSCLNFWWFSRMIKMLRKRFPQQHQQEVVTIKEKQ